MEHHRCCGWAALAVTMFALLLQVMAVSLPFWKWTDVYDNISVNTTRLSHSYVHGLWTICDLENGYSSCLHPSELTAWTQAVRALEVIPTIVLFLVAVTLTVYLSCFSRNLGVHVFLIALLCTCVILILAGVIVFGINAEDGSLHFALAFAVLAAVLALIAAILLLVMIVCAKRPSNKKNYERKPSPTVSSWD